MPPPNLKQACLKACSEATTLDAELASGKSAPLDAVSRHTLTSKYREAVSHLQALANVELSQAEAYKRSQPGGGSRLIGALIANIEVYLQRKKQYEARIAQLEAPPPATTTARRPLPAGDDDGDGPASTDWAALSEKPNVRWDDIAGLETAKSALREAVVLPLIFPQLFRDGRDPWTGIMLYGPPGTGKSFLAKAVATEVDSTFILASAADLTSKWLGESEKIVKRLFAAARARRPSIVFIDEIDSIATARCESESESARRIKTELLIQMDGVGNTLDGILVLCATNLPWAIDPALRRRCQRRIYIPLPDQRARRVMIQREVAKVRVAAMDADDVDTLVALTEGFSCSDLAVAIREAVMEPVRLCQSAEYFCEVADPDDAAKTCITPCSPGDPRVFRSPEDGSPLQTTLFALMERYHASQLRAPPVTFKHLLDAFGRSRSSVSREDLHLYDAFTREFGSQ